MDWDTIFTLARSGTKKAVNDWIARATITGGRIQGSAAIVPAGSLKSDVRIDSVLLQFLAISGVPKSTATEIARVVAAAWDDWANGFAFKSDSAYPTFLAVASSSTPTTRSAPISLRASAVSSGDAALQMTLTAKLSGALASALVRSEVAGAPEAAVISYASWMAGSLKDWTATTSIVGLQGRGSAPTFAPPYVPVAPVSNGQNITVGSLFAGPAFGRAF